MERNKLPQKNGGPADTFNVPVGISHHSTNIPREGLKHFTTFPNLVVWNGQTFRELDPARIKKGEGIEFQDGNPIQGAINTKKLVFLLNGGATLEKIADGKIFLTCPPTLRVINHKTYGNIKIELKFKDGKLQPISESSVDISEYIRPISSFKEYEKEIGWIEPFLGKDKKTNESSMAPDEYPVSEVFKNGQSLDFSTPPIISDSHETPESFLSGKVYWNQETPLVEKNTKEEDIENLTSELWRQNEIARSLFGKKGQEERFKRAEKLVEEIHQTLLKIQNGEDGEKNDKAPAPTDFVLTGTSSEEKRNPELEKFKHNLGKARRAPFQIGDGKQGEYSLMKNPNDPNFKRKLKTEIIEARRAAELYDEAQKNNGKREPIILPVSSVEETLKPTKEEAITKLKETIENAQKQLVENAITRKTLLEKLTRIKK